MRAVLLQPNEAPVIRDINASLRGLQEIVGGYIEVIPYPGMKDVVIVCNEEGKLLGLRENRHIYVDGKPVDCICGDAVVIGVDGEEFAELDMSTALTVALWAYDGIEEVQI